MLFTVRQSSENREQESTNFGAESRIIDSTMESALYESIDAESDDSPPIDGRQSIVSRSEYATIDDAMEATRHAAAIVKRRPSCDFMDEDDGDRRFHCIVNVVRGDDRRRAAARDRTIGVARNRCDFVVVFKLLILCTVLDKLMVSARPLTLAADSRPSVAAARLAERLFRSQYRAPAATEEPDIPIIRELTTDVTEDVEGRVVNKRSVKCWEAGWRMWELSATLHSELKRRHSRKRSPISRFPAALQANRVQLSERLYIAFSHIHCKIEHDFSRSHNIDRMRGTIGSIMNILRQQMNGNFGDKYNSVDCGRLPADMQQHDLHRLKHWRIDEISDAVIATLYTHSHCTGKR